MIEDQTEGQQPAKVEERQKPRLVPPFWKVLVDELCGGFLNEWEEWRDLLYLRRIGAFRPGYDSSSCVSDGNWDASPME